jgi:nitrogen-specific signal transduction histidine kinase/ActR/RegA family two-component response regulator
VEYQSVGEDITNEKRLEQELRQGQKMEALGRLAGGVAHDFNNLLTAINGYSQIMLRRLPSDDPHRGFVQEIMQAGERAAALTRQLLLFSRRETPHRRAVDLNELVEGIVRMLERVIGEDVKVVTHLAPDLHPLEADPGHVEQVVLNLAINARDAMPQGGLLTLKTENLSLADAEVRYGQGLGSGDFIHLSVADTGTGMDEDTRGRIFEPFFTTKEKGTGLGLAVVYGIVQEHGGWIQLDSVLGVGTTFHVYLPALGEGALGSEDATSGDAVELEGGNECVLLVEDDPDVRDFVARILNDQEYTVLVAHNATDAITLFEQEQDCIDLVFTDVILPDGTGLELADELLARKEGLRILAGTGYLDDRVRPTDLAARGITLLRKPYDLPDVLRALREALQTK